MQYRPLRSSNRISGGVLVADCKQVKPFRVDSGMAMQGDAVMPGEELGMKIRR